jgi:hypothetical protein
MKRISLVHAIVVLIAATQFGCGTLQRSPASGYRAQYESGLVERRDLGRDRRRTSMHELGITDPSDISSDDEDAIAARMRLEKFERTLEGRRETEQYYRNKPYMQSDDDRMTFLNLDSFEARAHWLDARHIAPGAMEHAPQIQALVDVNDITLGMTKQAVRDSWGEPELVEVAGNPMYGNERWHYSEQTSSAEGYNTERRLVYFSSGLVNGWETRAD